MDILGVACVTLMHSSETNRGLDILEIIFPDYTSGGGGGLFFPAQVGGDQ